MEKPDSVFIRTAWCRRDDQVGQLLKKLDDLGIADNTIVIYTTDNGAETFTWPNRRHHAPFRGERWEGRLPFFGDGPLARSGATAYRVE